MDQTNEKSQNTKLSTCRFIQTEVAWAAGFFDGEGSSWYTNKNKYNFPQVGWSIRQTERATLIRFRRVLGFGKVNGPIFKGRMANVQYELKFTCFEEAQAAIAIIWKYLSSTKKEQWKVVSKTFLDYAKNNKLRESAGVKRKYGRMRTFGGGLLRH